MGFLQALIQIGQAAKQADGTLGQPVPADFLEYPLDLPGAHVPADRRPQVIFVVLRVANAEAVPLDVQGVEDLILQEYQGGEGSGDYLRKYFFRSPVGSNTTWVFSPVMRMGKGKAGPAAMSQLAGEGGRWRSDKKSIFYKIHRRTLAGMQELGYFTPGSTDRVLADLETRLENLAALWSDPGRSYLLVFGARGSTGQLLFPGDLPAVQQHFDRRLTGLREDCPPTACGICQGRTDQFVSLSSLFKFATFDKRSFLPGGQEGSAAKVFPLCWHCFAILSRGKQILDTQYTTRLAGTNVEVQIVPEMLGAAGPDPLVLQASRKVFVGGVESEPDLFEEISEQGAAFVDHFLLVEQNQSQVLLHRLIEDVPPTRLKKIKALWDAARRRASANAQAELKPEELGKSLRRMVAIINSLAGESENDQQVMADQALGMIANLLNNQPVSAQALKQAAVARIPGLLHSSGGKTSFSANGDTPPGENRNAAHTALDQAFLLLEFIHAFNHHLTTPEVPA